MENFYGEVYRLVDEGFKNYNDLPEFEKNHLLALSTTEDDLIEVIDEDILKQLKACIIHSKFHHALDLIYKLRVKLSDLSEVGIKIVFDECSGQLQNNKNLEAGLKPYRDMINGEIRWLKP